MTVVMIGITILAYASGISSLINKDLPLSMHDMPTARPAEVGTILVILGALLTAADIGLIAYLTRGRLQGLANIGSLAAWVCSLLVFFWGAATGLAWMLFLLLTLPPLITWILSGPSIRIAGHSW